MKKHVLRAGLAVTAAAALIALAGCSGGGTEGASATADPKAKVTITVGDEPTADKKADRENFLKKVDDFQKLYPNITVKPSTEYWQAQTFQAKLAGGTLPTTMTVSLTMESKPLDSFNVAGLVEGSDPRLKDEVIVLSAHLDHLGISAPVKGDSIYNGAMDNAAGIATLLDVRDGVFFSCAVAVASGPEDF